MNVSSDSTVVSPATATLTVCEVTPGANVNVPDPTVKSLPAVADPFAVAHCTVTGAAAAFDNDTVKTAFDDPDLPSSTPTEAGEIDTTGTLTAEASRSSLNGSANDTTPPGMDSPPPVLKEPQVTTEPSSFSAANAPMLETICVTPLPSLAASGGVPVNRPQVATEPSLFNAAKPDPPSEFIDTILTTPLLNLPETLLLSPPWSSDPQVTTEPSAFTAANAPKLAYIAVTPLDNRLAMLECVQRS